MLQCGERVLPPAPLPFSACAVGCDTSAATAARGRVQPDRVRVSRAAWAIGPADASRGLGVSGDRRCARRRQTSASARSSTSTGAPAGSSPALVRARPRSRRSRRARRSCASPGARSGSPRARRRRRARSAAVRNVVRPSDGRARAPSGGRRAAAGAASRSPCSRRSAGSMNTQKQTIVESGLPGRPNTSVSPRRPNHIGLPGLIRTRQNTSSTPQASNAGLTWSCGPTETPPETTSTSPASPASTAATRRVAVVADDAVVDHLGARALRQQAHHQPVGLVDPPRLGRRAERQQLAAGDDQVQPRRGGGPRPRRRRPRPAPRCAGASAPRRRGASTSPARRSSPRHADVRPGRERALGRDVAVALVGQLGLQDRVGARRERRAGRDRAPPCRARASPRPPRRPRRRRPAAAARPVPCRPRAPRSRPSPSGRTAAGRPR